MWDVFVYCWVAACCSIWAFIFIVSVLHALHRHISQVRLLFHFHTALVSVGWCVKFVELPFNCQELYAFILLFIVIDHSDSCQTFIHFDPFLLLHWSHFHKFYLLPQISVCACVCVFVCVCKHYSKHHDPQHQLSSQKLLSTVLPNCWYHW